MAGRVCLLLLLLLLLLLILLHGSFNHSRAMPVIRKLMIESGSRRRCPSVTCLQMRSAKEGRPCIWRAGMATWPGLDLASHNPLSETILQRAAVPSKPPRLARRHKSQ